MTKITLAEKEKVTEMFDSIAGRYDFLNRFLSLRSDVRWRRKMIRRVCESSPALVLDVATGTADVAIACVRAGIPEVKGVDLSQKMLEAGIEKIRELGLEKNIQLLRGDAEEIGFPDDTFDAVTVAFGVRNFENLEKGLSEMRRVLKPGGNVWILEFARPRPALIRAVFYFYFRNILPFIGKRISGNRKAYRYLFDSSMRFPSDVRFTEILARCGYRNTGFTRYTWGIACLYHGNKPVA